MRPMARYRDDPRALERLIEADRVHRDVYTDPELAQVGMTEAQERYKAGVSDNLAVSQALQSMAQADNRYVGSLYQHNIAKLSLARALGVAASSYKTYVGGK